MKTWENYVKLCRSTNGLLSPKENGRKTEEQQKHKQRSKGKKAATEEPVFLFPFLLPSLSFSPHRKLKEKRGKPMEQQQHHMNDCI